MDDAYFEHEERQDVEDWIDRVLSSSRSASRGKPHERIEDPSNPKRLGLRLLDERLRLYSVPSGWGVFVTASRKIRTLELSADMPPERLYIECWPELQYINLAGVGRWRGSLVIDLAQTQYVRLDARMSPVSDLDVQRGNLHLDTKKAPERVVLHSAMVIGLGKIQSLTVSGQVGLPEGCSALTTHLVGDTTLVGAEERALGRIEAKALKGSIKLGNVRATGSASLRLLSRTQVRTLPTGRTVSVAEDVRLRVTEHIENVSFAGEGFVDLQSAAGVSFPEEGGPTLIVGPRASVLDATGSISELRIDGGKLSGRPAAPLRVGSVVVENGGEMDDVDLSEMQSVGDVMRLQTLDRLSPWMPSALDEIEDLAATKPTASPGVRHVFWAYFSELVSKKKGLGASQSAFRYAATHARMLAATRLRERAWLRLYRMVGYGESILLPVLWHLAMALVILNFAMAGLGLAPAATLENADLHDWPDLLLMGWRIFILPLSFYRLSNDGVLEGWLADVIVPIYRVLGILMVFFALAAIRRLTKAE